MRLQLLTLIIVCCSLSFGQFNYDRYKPARLDSIYSFNAGIIDSKAQITILATDIPYRIEVEYGDSIRPIGSFVGKVIWGFLKSHSISKADSFVTKEALFYEDSIPYWIPVQSPVLSFFKDELKPKDKVTIFVAVIGATSKSLVMTLNEFDKQ
jgi:hypothetical protein